MLGLSILVLLFIYCRLLSSRSSRVIMPLTPQVYRVTLPLFSVQYSDPESYTKFTMSFYGASLGQRIARRDIEAAGLAAFKAKDKKKVKKVNYTQGCQMAKFDPFLSLDCARVEGVGAQSKERKGSNFAA